MNFVRKLPIPQEIKEQFPIKPEWAALRNEKIQELIDIFEGKLYIQTGKVKPVSKQLAENPKAEICAFKDGVWLRVACELVNDDRIEAKKSMLDAYENLRGMYDENDDNTQVLYIKDAVATFSSFAAPEEVVKF